MTNPRWIHWSHKSMYFPNNRACRLQAGSFSTNRPERAVEWAMEKLSKTRRRKEQARDDIGNAADVIRRKAFDCAQSGARRGME